MKPEKVIHVKILRSDPDGPGGHYQSYVLPFSSGLSVMNVLQQIWEDLDPSLAFYCSCRTGKCRGCFVEVNGYVRMGCTTLVKGDLVIKPWPKYTVIRDLVVDLDRPLKAERD